MGECVACGVSCREFISCDLCGGLGYCTRKCESNDRANHSVQCGKVSKFWDIFGHIFSDENTVRTIHYFIDLYGSRRIDIDGCDDGITVTLGNTGVKNTDSAVRFKCGDFSMNVTLTTNDYRDFFSNISESTRQYLSLHTQTLTIVVGKYVLLDGERFFSFR